MRTLAFGFELVTRNCLQSCEHINMRAEFRDPARMPKSGMSDPPRMK